MAVNCIACMNKKLLFLLRLLSFCTPSGLGLCLESRRDEACAAEIFGRGDTTFAGSLERKYAYGSSGGAYDERVALNGYFAGSERSHVEKNRGLEYLDGTLLCIIGYERRPCGGIGRESAHMIVDCLGRGVPAYLAVLFEYFRGRSGGGVTDELVLRDGA